MRIFKAAIALAALIFVSGCLDTSASVCDGQAPAELTGIEQVKGAEIYFTGQKANGAQAMTIARKAAGVYTVSGTSTGPGGDFQVCTINGKTIAAMPNSSDNGTNSYSTYMVKYQNDGIFLQLETANINLLQQSGLTYTDSDSPNGQSSESLAEISVTLTSPADAKRLMPALQDDTMGMSFLFVSQLPPSTTPAQ